MFPTYYSSVLLTVTHINNYNVETFKLILNYNNYVGQKVDVLVKTGIKMSGVYHASKINVDLYDQLGKPYLITYYFKLQ